MLEWELIGPVDLDEDKRPDFKDLQEYEQRYILRDAYEEKAFRECEEHRWELNIEFGHISVQCFNCRGFYSEINPDYVEDLCFSAPIYSLQYKEDRDSYSGEVNDYWLEAE